MANRGLGAMVACALALAACGGDGFEAAEDAVSGDAEGGGDAEAETAHGETGGAGGASGEGGGNESDGGALDASEGEAGDDGGATGDADAGDLSPNGWPCRSWGAAYDGSGAVGHRCTIDRCECSAGTWCTVALVDTDPMAWGAECAPLPSAPRCSTAAGAGAPCSHDCECPAGLWCLGPPVDSPSATCQPPR